MSRQVPLVTSLTFRSLGGPGRSEDGEVTICLHSLICFLNFSVFRIIVLESFGEPTMHFTPQAFEYLRTEHVDSDFDHLVSGNALCVDDVSAAVVELALWDQDH